MIMGQYRQQPAERRRRSVDYGPWLGDTETVLGLVPSVSPTTVPPLVVDGLVTDVDGKEVSYFISGGLDGTEYTVTFLATISDGQIREDEISITIEEDA